MSNLLLLVEIKRDVQVEVVEIQGGWGVRQRLNQMGIHPRDKIIVKKSGFMKGPMLVEVHGMDVAIGRGMAQKVLVKEIG